jgi:Predicted AAA-ATPase/PD-(D/E)XK nuclease superfamily
MQKLPLGIQTFSEIRNQNYLYVDKTQDIFRMIDSGKYFFFSRPRRFGKSLLLDTLHNIFEGNQSLFKGLWIENKIDWKPYPVIRIDFGRVVSRDGNLIDALLKEIARNANRLGVTITNLNSPSIAFGDLLDKVCLKYGENSIVLLIDEYDKALVDFIDDQVLFAYNRDILRGFYTNIKSYDACIKFTLLTGVSKIGKMSLFSGLNNINDISLDKEYANLCGISQDELESNFKEHIDTFAKIEEKERIEILDLLKRWYNGYSWNGQTTLYNPYSLLNVFQKNVFQNYWFDTGTPTLLIKMVSQNQRLFDTFKNYVVGDSWSMSSFNPQSNDDIGLMFQTGYLTIKEIEKNTDGMPSYKLGFPNQEVEYSFAKYLLAEYITTAPERLTNDLAYPMKNALYEADIEAFTNCIKVAFSKIPHHLFIEKEAFYHSMLLMLMMASGIIMRSEEASSKGRSDLVLETNDSIYIFEFKLNQSAEVAIDQIMGKGYANPYLMSSKKVVLVGINFKNRELNEWKVKRIDSAL